MLGCRRRVGSSSCCQRRTAEKLLRQQLDSRQGGMLSSKQPAMLSMHSLWRTLSAWLLICGSICIIDMENLVWLLLMTRQCGLLLLLVRLCRMQLHILLIRHRKAPLAMMLLLRPYKTKLPLLLLLLLCRRRMLCSSLLYRCT